MDKLYLGDILLFDFSTIIKSTQIKGIKFVSEDPGYEYDNGGIIYLIQPTDGINNDKLFLRYYSDLYEIGTKIPEIPTSE